MLPGAVARIGAGRRPPSSLWISAPDRDRSRSTKFEHPVQDIAGDALQPAVHPGDEPEGELPSLPSRHVGHPRCAVQRLLHASVALVVRSCEHRAVGTEGHCGRAPAKPERPPHRARRSGVPEAHCTVVAPGDHQAPVRAEDGDTNGRAVGQVLRSHKVSSPLLEQRLMRSDVDDAKARRPRLEVCLAHDTRPAIEVEGQELREIVVPIEIEQVHR